MQSQQEAPLSRHKKGSVTGTPSKSAPFMPYNVFCKCSASQFMYNIFCDHVSLKILSYLCLQLRTPQWPTGPDVQATSTYQTHIKTERKWFHMDANVMFCNIIMFECLFCLLVKMACKNLKT
jgi:hypothetical protein